MQKANKSLTTLKKLLQDRPQNQRIGSISSQTQITPHEQQNSIADVTQINLSLNKCLLQPQISDRSGTLENTQGILTYKNLGLVKIKQFQPIFQSDNSFCALLDKGIQFQKEQKYKEALKYYQRAEKLDKTNPSLYYMMAGVCQKLQDIRNARIWAYKLTELDPKAAQNQLIQRITAKYLKHQINKGFSKRQDPHLTNPRRVGWNNIKQYLEQQDKNQTNPRDKNVNQPIKREFTAQILKTSQNSKETQRRVNISVAYRDFENLRSKSPLKVQNPLQYPCSAVGFIASKFKIKGKLVTQKGTGCFIGTNIVLTAAHNIYNIKENLQSTEIVYIPAPQFPKGAAYRAKKCFVPLQYSQHKQQAFGSQSKTALYDYALIQLETDLDLQSKYGSLSYDFNWIQTSVYLKQLSQSKVIENVKILGFPEKEKQEHQLTEFQGNALVDTNYLTYKHPTRKGVSGAPNIEFVNEQYFVRAIHSRDIKRQIKSNKKNIKAGLQLRSDMFQDLKKHFTYTVSLYDLSRNSYML